MTSKEPQIPVPDDAHPVSPIVVAEKHLQRVLGILDDLADELDARDDKATAKVKGLSAEVRAAVQSVLNERHRIGKLEDHDDDTGDGLDLDAAKLEIGRRLALLRDRGGSEALPGGPEQ